MSNSKTEEIVEAKGEPDYVEVAACMNEFLAWMRIRYASQLWIIDRYFDQAAWNQELASLGHRYAPPGGAILMARVGGQVAGCVMFHDLGEGICEMKRLFIKADYHGLGLGRRLTTALVDLARKRNYRKMRLDTGPLQPEALALYRSLQFEEIGAYHDYPDDLKKVMFFLERPL